MRTKFLYLAFVWLFGISVGAVQASYEKMFVLAAVIMFASFLGSRWPRALVVGAGLLFILGALWGRDGRLTQFQGSSLKDCTAAFPLQGVVSDRPVYKGIQGRFFLGQANHCKYLAYAEGPDKIFRGDEVAVTGRFQRTDEIAGEDPSFRDYLTSQGAHGVVRGEVIVQQSHVTWIQRIREHLVGRLYRLFPEPEGTLAAAMIFDERGGIPDDVQDEFRMTGTSHILAISGSNITLLAGMLLVVFLIVPINPWWRTVIMLGIMWLYIILIDRPVSAVRANVFWTAALLAFRLSSLVSLASVVVLAVLLMVSLKPVMLLDVGFQLSVAAVTGIGLALFLAKRLFLEGKRLGLPDLALSSVGAFMATWPIVMYHFDSLAWIGLLANLVVVPLMSLLYDLMVVTLLIDFVSHLMASVAAGVAHALWIGIHIATHWFALVPYGYIEDVGLPVWAIFAYYALIVVLASVWLSRQKRSWLEVWE